MKLLTNPRAWRWPVRVLGVVAALSLSAPGAFG